MLIIYDNVYNLAYLLHNYTYFKHYKHIVTLQLETDIFNKVILILLLLVCWDNSAKSHD